MFKKRLYSCLGGGRLSFRSLVAALSLLAALAFFSCSGMAGEAPFVPQNSSNPSKVPAKKVMFRGTLASASAVPQKALSFFTVEEADGVLKSAAPDAGDMTKYEYFATATSQSGLVENGEFGDTPATARLFSISLAMGEKWTITCGLREAATKIPMMTDSCGFEPKEEEQIFSHVFTIVPCKEGSGSVALEMTIPATIIGATVECSDPRWEAASPEASVVGTTLAINVASIQSGYYDAYIRLYNSDGVLACGFWEGINVFDGAKTNYWLSSGGTAGVTVSGGALAVGEAALSAFSKTLFYVGDTGVVGAKGKSDSNDGNSYSPFETLNKAVAVIKSTGAAGKDYKIYVSGTVEGCADLSSALDGKARSITIEGLGALGTDSKPAAALDAKQGGRALMIGTRVPVTLKNLRVTGGLHESDFPVAGGAGIYLGGSADLTLAGDVVVERNHAKWYAGGIFASGGASLKIKGAVTVYGNTHGAAASTAASNLYLSSGAKIQILGALKTTDASGERKAKIGVSSDDVPTHAAPVDFTKDYGASNAGTAATEYFYGDKYGVAAAASGEAALCVSGGSASLEDLYDDITISIDKTLSAKDIAEKKFTFSSNASDVSYTFSVAYHGETLPQSYYTTGTDSVTLLDVPVGSYMICVTALYGGKTYGGEFEVKIVGYADVEKAISEIQSLAGTSGTVAVEGSITSDNVSSIVSAIKAAYESSHDTRIKLDMSQTVGIAVLPSFQNCDGLCELLLPEGITTLGSFWDCSYLENLYIPSTVTSVNGDYFMYAPTNIVVAENSPYFKNSGNALYSKDGKTLVMYSNKNEVDSSFSVPAEVEVIGANAFANSKIKTITFESNVTMKKIEQNAFDRASNLVSIDLPDSVTELGRNLFVYCNKLQSVELPASLKKIPSGFLNYGPPQVTSIVIPDGVTEIGESAFWEAKKLETITIPVSVVKICAKAFYCSSYGIGTVNYKGSSAQKDAIVIENSDGKNDKIVNAAWNCDYVGD